MKQFEPKPFDIEAYKRDPPPWPSPQYIADVMAELLSEQRGYPVKFILTPKDAPRPTGG